MGALLVLQKKGLLDRKLVLATAPVAKLAEVLACELYLRTHESPFASEFKSLFEHYKIALEDISKAFAHIHPRLKYSESFTFSGGDHGLLHKVENFFNPPPQESTAFPVEMKFTALPSGYSMGGTIWQIEAGGKQVLYAPRLCLRNSLALLDGSSVGSDHLRPHLVILDGTPFIYSPQQNA